MTNVTSKNTTEANLNTINVGGPGWAKQFVSYPPQGKEHAETYKKLNTLAEAYVSGIVKIAPRGTGLAHALKMFRESVIALGTCITLEGQSFV